MDLRIGGTDGPELVNPNLNSLHPKPNSQDLIVSAREGQMEIKLEGSDCNS
jgi:hypothetical protein